MKYINLRAYGKINLSLDITGKREDGYHMVRMVMQTVDIYDKLYMEMTEEPDIKLTTNIPFVPCDSSNIVYKAVDLIRREYNIKEGVFIKLRKAIPVSAGMGGGSADAAAALKGMNRLFNLKISREKLKEYGAILGADVPYLIDGGTALCEGIGEKLTPIEGMPSCKLIIIKPKVSASTKQIYTKYDEKERTYHPNVDAMVKAIEEGNADKMCALLGNVLEEVTAKEYKIIHELKHELKEAGAKGVLMSGSGTTVFGIFAPDADTKKIKSDFMKKNTVRSVFDSRFMVNKGGKLVNA
ncbi:MAG: 4-(cytidine 5'-diphospho)-2-C-methyl-D-erythritol kinase [Lachnospiraceae bacterium]|jgi:4-diphosphocytidyl-2-C-methyl-D-erythritol kinase|nr:4-(cytidine 5'-diphospho)-2-C-methyl-D-erythritol kinase [Lachnospiraceae bacterium]